MLLSFCYLKVKKKNKQTDLLHFGLLSSLQHCHAFVFVSVSRSLLKVSFHFKLATSAASSQQNKSVFFFSPLISFEWSSWCISTTLWLFSGSVPAQAFNSSPTLPEVLNVETLAASCGLSEGKICPGHFNTPQPLFFFSATPRQLISLHFKTRATEPLFVGEGEAHLEKLIIQKEEEK